MTEKTTKEWFLDVPWGRLAMISWGDPVNPPLLLVHGYVDTAATFLPLVAAMPDVYHFVSFDLPGHGRSDSMPGPPISYLNYVEAVRQIVGHMRWDNFDCIAHSMGYLVSVYYNALFPGRLRRLVSLAGTIGIGVHGLSALPEVWFQLTYATYYSRYSPPPPTQIYTYEEAVKALAKAREISQELAAVLATRCLEPAGDGRVRYTWDMKAKKIFSVYISDDILYSVLSVPTSTLSIVPTEDSTPSPFENYTAEMLDRLKSDKYVLVQVPGGHSFHMSSPGNIVPHILKFLSSKSKL